jgi:membrane protease YdiL (CAAX protease family)
METPPRVVILRRVAAVFEVLGVYLAGSLVIDWIVQAFSLQLSNPLPEFRVDISDAALLTAAWQLGVLLLLQYAGWFLLIIPINAWHRRRGPAAYGLTRAGRSWSGLVLAGLGMVALTFWLTLGVSLLNTVYHLGETVPWRQALFDTSWRRWEFWVFMGVASWGGVALLEELFFRGYCQRRLAEDWGDGPAIVGVACLFVFAHSQYLSWDAYNLGTAASLFGLAIGFGVLFAVTRSIVPSFVAHALINVPMTPPWQGICMAVCVIVATIVWRRGRDWLRQAFAGTRGWSCVVLGAAGAGWAVVARQFEASPHVAMAMVVCAVVMHVFERRRNARVASPSTQPTPQRAADLVP